MEGWVIIIPWNLSILKRASGREDEATAINHLVSSRNPASAK